MGADKLETGTRTNCQEASDEISREEAQKARTNEPFCGELVYHNGTSVEHTSNADQDLRSTSKVTVGTFDVVTTNVVDVDFFLCSPFCRSDAGGDLTWEAVHEAGALAGVTEGPDETDDQHSGGNGTAGGEGSARGYGQGISFHYPTASYVLQENTGAWEMNGWWGPSPAKNFVAYLYDTNGQPIGADRLGTLVDKLQTSDELSEDTRPIVCGWTPDFQFTSINFEGSSCEIKFEYREPSSTDPDFKAEEDYNDPCESPAWVCGAFSGPAWYSRGWFPTGGTFQTNTNMLDGTTFEYIQFHWFVAGHASECKGAQEPGYSFETPAGADHPYLAHEVDVFSKPTDVRGVSESKEATNVKTYAHDAAAERVDENLSALPGLPSNPAEHPKDAYPSQVYKETRVEPNADPVGGLGDSSQSLADDPDLQRSLDDACSKITSNEVPETVDPWVDRVDGGVDTETQQNPDSDAGASASESTAGVTLTGRNLGTAPFHTDGVGLYGNSAEGQDQENQGTGDLFRTDGNVGMFTDKNDDGDYDALSGNPTVLSSRHTYALTADKYDVNNIQSAGAYPMLWDMWVKDEGGELVVDESAGCAGIADQPFAAEMKDAGYGPETALFQAVYLSEPTTFVSSDTGETVAYPGGDNIYLFLSQSARAHYDDDTTSANDVDAEIEEAVTSLKSSVAGGADVEIPGDAFGLQSDFMPQCHEDTGGFTLEFSFSHACEADCSGDTIVTGYTFEVNRTDGTLGGEDSQTVPKFTVGGDAYDFGQGQHTWTDVDPFDNNPDRQDDTDDSPPTGN